MLKCEIERIIELFKFDIISIKNIEDLNILKIKYLGRNGLINNFFNKIKEKKIKFKSKYFNLINILKININNFIITKNQYLLNNENKKFFDITIPGIGNDIGSMHIINQIIIDIENFFLKNKFIKKNGKDIDTLYYNFDSLNMSVDHPSRKETDTFYINNSLLLRTHTSNMQIHVLEKSIPPIKIISCGKVYRKDCDLSHTPMFHQIEGFIIDIDISLSTLKHLLFEFFNFFFKDNIEFKFRPSYFPFTEPSFEVDIKCVHCLGLGCNVCKNSGWIEVLGCGIINPFILNKSKINKNIYKGLAFGIGIERLAMIKFKINDIKLFYENNIEFLKQF